MVSMWLAALSVRASGSLIQCYPKRTSSLPRVNLPRQLSAGWEKKLSEPHVTLRSKHAPPTACDTTATLKLSPNCILTMSNLDEDSVDEILYLARANETADLEQFLSALSTQVSKPKDQILAEAVDSYSQNTALHYAAANGHNGTLHL